jgi:protein O-mannosyl-transferase
MSRRKKHRQAGAAARPEVEMPPRPRAMGDTMQAIAVALLLGGALWLVYGAALDAPFIFDDADSVLSNSSITQLWPLVGDKQHPGPLNPPPHSAVGGRPLVNLSLATNYYFGQYDPRGYHLVNLGLHLISALLLWAIMRRTLRLEYFGGRFDGASGPLALAAALLWTLHPLQTETIQYVTQRTELMVGMWYLATLYASLRYWSADAPASRGAWLTVATAACLAGMASKEVMVSAPLVVLLFDRTFVAGSFRAAGRRSWPLYVGLFSSWLLLVLLNYSGPRNDSAGFQLGVPLLDWWFNQTSFLLMYLKLAVWPWPLVLHYYLPQLEPLSSIWPSVAAVALLVASLLWLLWRNHPAGFVGAAALLVLAPTSLVPITTEVAAERRMYLPLAALMAAAVVGCYGLAQWGLRQLRPRVLSTAARRKGPVWVIGLALTAAIVYSLVDVYRLEDYRDPIVLWRQTLVHQPENPYAHYNLAIKLSDADQYGEAIDHFREAIRLKRDYTSAHYSLGITLAKAGQTSQAIECLREAVRLDPDAVKIRNNLGVLLFSTGQFDEAVSQFRRVVELDTDMWEAYDNLGRSLDRSGKPQAAIENYKHALRLKPDDLKIYANLARVYAESNRPADAIATAQAALELAQATGQAGEAQRLAAWLADYRAGTPAAADRPHPTEPQP